MKNLPFVSVILNLLLFCFPFVGHAQPLSVEAYRASLTADFAARDRLPQTANPRPPETGKWNWGPKPLRYPPVTPPPGVNPGQWKRDRIIAVAEKYIGLPYMHRHIPSQGGLDCSNFTSWVYNYGLGIRFTSNVHRQAQEAGRQLKPDEQLEPGDLLFIWNKAHTKISHVVIYVNDKAIIDSTISKSANGVALRPFKGWYRKRLAYARRIIEPRFGS